MPKLLAIARTVYLVFIVGYTVRAMPFFVVMPRTHDESYARCTESLGLVTRAAWLAVAWIALETIIGWLAMRGRKAAAPPDATAGAR